MKPCRYALRWAVLGLLVLAAPQTARAAAARDAEAANRDAGVKYTVEIAGAPTGTVRALLRQNSQLEALRKRFPPTPAALVRRIRADEARFRAILESEGYYGATVASTSVVRGESTHVQVSIDPGAPYTVASAALDAGDRADIVGDPAVTAPLTALAGKPARAQAVIAAEDAVLRLLRQRGYPFARRGERRVAVDSEARRIAVVLPIDLGRRATFGTTRFAGAERTKPEYLAGLVPWTAGTAFDAGQLDRFQLALVRSSLFSAVSVKPADDAEAPDGAPLDVAVDVAEGPHRSLTLAAKYARDTGVGGSVGWQNRNLFGSAEILDLSLDADRLSQIAKAALTTQNWRRLDQTLKLTAAFERSTTDAFDGLSAQVAGGIERRVSRHWVLGGAASAEIARLTEHGVRRRSLLFGVPLTAVRHVSDDIADTAVVDATRGWRLAVAVTPYRGTYLDSVTFVRMEAEGDAYVPLDRAERIVLAGRLKLGSIVGAATARIPADRRFYGGGGGSVRGYGFQLVGPLDASGQPTGGRSLIETGIEARLRVSRSIGLVPFVDAGSVADAVIPGRDATLRTAVGLGLRYFTGVGPLRLDVAVPLDKRPGVDKGFQFYLSFGQAF
jgi:translocation and assembly module TamA